MQIKNRIFMNTHSLKTDLQQVLDSDIALRKEFTDLKRSLSDYRNQLILRDEDCKRLQVTIDVLNTKLTVMERDNTNYKAELAAFKELRGTIKEQLHNKQSEIDERLIEIETLKAEVSSIASVYEQKIESLKNEAAIQLETVKQEYILQINDLRSNSHYKESGLKEEFENRVNELSSNLADREQSLTYRHQEELLSVKSSYEEKITFLNNDFNSQLQKLSSASENEISHLKNSHSNALTALEESTANQINSLKYGYENEISALKSQLEEQRSSITGDYQAKLESLTFENTQKEQQLISGYESQIAELKLSATTDNEELTASFQNEISLLKSGHESLINELTASHELVIQQITSANETLVQEITSGYEEKLSNTLIHSNLQNSKLTEELNKAQLENDHYKEKARELVYHVDAQNSQLEVLNTSVNHFESLLKAETQKLSDLNNEFENFKLTSSLSSSEQVNELNAKIESLNTELLNLAGLFENATNTLSETQFTLEQKNLELENASQNIQQLHSEINNLQASVSEKEQCFENFKSEQAFIFSQQVESQDIEFKKLLAENTNLINEIDMAQDKVEAQEAEITLLKTELDSINAQSVTRVEELKETLSSKNFTITNLEGTNAGLEQEISLLKAELAEMKNQVSFSSQSDEQISSLQHNLDSLTSEKHNLLSEINLLQATIGDLNNSVSDLSAKISGYESEVQSLKNSTNTEEQDAFIDRLFKQIDILNDERLGLLNEKEQMANQLLKMNDVISGLSQNIESQHINVSDLNNHRKNVILGSNSGGTSEKSQMKSQINDLVREIDKCIALLGA
ncbi:MAG: hypothetical protein JWO32_2101 [Bacteroidetes bacterium]|nr:hypothetical protein [Bacteroidota bacterium]